MIKMPMLVLLKAKMPDNQVLKFDKLNKEFNYLKNIFLVKAQRPCTKYVLHKL